MEGLEGMQEALARKEEEGAMQTQAYCQESITQWITG
jgi:hypothetical protein